MESLIVALLIVFGFIYFLSPKVGANIASYNWWQLVISGKQEMEREYSPFLLTCVRAVGMGLIILGCAIAIMSFLYS